MERERLFYRLKAIYKTEIGIQYISKKHYLIIKSKMYNFMCVDEMKIKIFL